MPIDQDTLNAKFQKYLKLQSERAEGEYDVDSIINKLESGHCHGYASLWLNQKTLANKEELLKEFELISKWDDRIESLERTVKLPLYKNTQTLKQLFEQTLHNVLYLQGGTVPVQKYGQHFVKLKQLIKAPDDQFNTVHLAEVGGFYKAKEIASLLKKVFQGGNRILIGSPIHTIALEKINGSYYFLNINDPSGHREFTNRKQLSEAILEAMFSEKDDRQLISLQIFRKVEASKSKSYVEIERQKHHDWIKKHTHIHVADLYRTYFLRRTPRISKLDVSEEEFLVFAIKEGNYFLVDQLLRYGSININALIDEQWSPLMHAARQGNVPIMARLLKEQSVNVNLRGVDEDTALKLCAYYGHEDCMQLLLKDKQLDLVLGHTGENALATAVQRGNLLTVKALLNVKTININVVDSSGSSLVEHAVENKQFDMVKLLLSSKRLIQASIDKALEQAICLGSLGIVDLILKESVVNDSYLNEDGLNYLTIAAKAGENQILARLCAHTKININAISINGWCPILAAVYHGHLGAIQTILRVPTLNINQPDALGMNALMLAAMDGHDKILHALLDMDDINLDMAENSLNKTALLYAAQKGHANCVKQLIDAGVDVEAVDSEGMNAFMLAVKNGHINVLRELISIKEFVEEYQEYALILVAHSGNLSMVSFLLDNLDIDINFQTEQGHSPLSLASAWGHHAIVKRLLQEPHIDTEIRLDSGQTALNLAINVNNKGVVESLIRKGASLASIDVEKPPSDSMLQTIEKCLIGDMNSNPFYSGRYQLQICEQLYKCGAYKDIFGKAAQYFKADSRAFMPLARLTAFLSDATIVYAKAQAELMTISNCLKEGPLSYDVLYAMQQKVTKCRKDFSLFSNSLQSFLHSTESWGESFEVERKITEAVIKEQFSEREVIEISFAKDGEVLQEQLKSQLKATKSPALLRAKSIDDDGFATELLKFLKSLSHLSLADKLNHEKNVKRLMGDINAPCFQSGDLGLLDVIFAEKNYVFCLKCFKKFGSKIHVKKSQIDLQSQLLDCSNETLRQSLLTTAVDCGLISAEEAVEGAKVKGLVSLASVLEERESPHSPRKI